MDCYLKDHLDYILREDPYFRQFWNGQAAGEHDVYMTVWELLDSAHRERDTSSDAIYFSAYDLARRLLVVVQEKDFSYSEVPMDWIAFARNSTAKRELYTMALERLRAVKSIGASGVRLYGGIKPDESIQQKLADGWSGRVLYDLWDLVRFRIVVPDLIALRTLSVELWQLFFDDVVRCRNYYYRPRAGPQDPYRAIHFEMRHEDRFFEIQLMTAYREAISVIDHRILLKKMLPFLDSGHEYWLRGVSRTANVIEAQAVSRSLTIDGVSCGM